MGVTSFADFFLCEVSLVLGGHLGSHARTLVLRMLLGLPSKGVEAKGHLENRSHFDNFTRDNLSFIIFFGILVLIFFEVTSSFGKISYFSSPRQEPNVRCLM